MNKMGESQIIDFFSTALRDALRKKFGDDASYSFGNFSGSQDRKFADVFAGTHTRCILVEFKELEIEVSDELNKPLRKKLCTNLSNDDARLSRTTHFIAYANKGSNICVKLSPYVDVVCPGFNIKCPPLEDAVRQSHGDFIDSFLEDSNGVTHKTFIDYVSLLNTKAGGIADGGTAPFKSILYSKSSTGKVVGTRFENLKELFKLLTLKPLQAKTHKP